MPRSKRPFWRPTAKVVWKTSISRSSRSAVPRLRSPKRRGWSRWRICCWHGRPGDRWLTETVRWAWRTKIQVHLNIDLRMRLWTAAEQEAIRVFASNLRDLLLAAPAGARVTMGLDPGFRSGVKVAVADKTGKVVATATIYPHEPARRWDEALATLGKLAVQHRVDSIAICNGTASRETDKLAIDLVKLLPELKMSK